MFKNLFFKNDEEITLYNSIKGTIIKIEDVPDEIFSKKIVGDGYAIIPTENIVYSPISGVIKVIMPTLHSIGIVSDDGLEVLIHIGIDTIDLGGDGFIAYKSVGDRVSYGDKILEFDKTFLNREDLCMITPVVITNSDAYDSIIVNYGEKKEKEVTGKIILNKGGF